MKIAIVHDQLQEFGGAERVLVALKHIYPEADIYTSFYNPKTLGVHARLFSDWNIYTSWAQRIPFVAKLYSPLRFITPYLWETLDLQSYDLVISSSGSYMSKGIVTKPETLHICYLHHPPRYLYFYETAREWKKYWPVRIYAYLVNHGLRIWDFLSSSRVDYFVANSEETKHRIEKFYRRESCVIYPPVDIPDTLPQYDSNTKQTYYITTSRLARAKHIDILIHAANQYHFELKIVGSGRDEDYLKSIAGKTVTFLGTVPDTELPALYHNAKAFLFASKDEEFGIAPIEAMGHGLPVVSLASGGLKETVHEGKNGYLFADLAIESIYQKISLLEQLSPESYEIMRKTSRLHAEKYSLQRFKTEIETFVNVHLFAKQSDQSL